MWKLTRKGLIANKLRFLLTGIAVVLGVAFVSGTFVLTATIQKTFDDLFTNIYSNTDSVVRAREVLSSDFGSGRSRSSQMKKADNGMTGTKDECSAHVDEVWTDMRPISLREQMSGQ